MLYIRSSGQNHTPVMMHFRYPPRHLQRPTLSCHTRCDLVCCEVQHATGHVDGFDVAVAGALENVEAHVQGVGVDAVVWVQGQTSNC